MDSDQRAERVYLLEDLQRRKEASYRTLTSEDPRNSKSCHIGVFTGSVESTPAGRKRYRVEYPVQPGEAPLPPVAKEFDAGGRAPEPTEQERQERARAELARVFESARVYRTTEDTLPYRIRVAYRLTRYMALALGCMSSDDFLVDPRSYDPEVSTPTPLVNDGPPILNKHVADRIRSKSYLGLLPPPYPPEAGGPDYDAYRDTSILNWCERLELIARALRIEAGSHVYPDMGRLGLIGLVDPETARDLWPDPEEILYCEQEIVSEALDQLTNVSHRMAKQWLHRRYGFVPEEVRNLLALAARSARFEISTDVEEQRAIMTMRLENFIDRSREALELRAELGGLKQLAIVQGLSKTDPEDNNTIFVDLARKMDRDDPPAIDVDYSVKP